MPPPLCGRNCIPYMGGRFGLGRRRQPRRQCPRRPRNRILEIVFPPSRKRWSFPKAYLRLLRWSRFQAAISVRRPSLPPLCIGAKRRPPRRRSCPRGNLSAYWRWSRCKLRSPRAQPPPPRSIWRALFSFGYGESVSLKLGLRFAQNVAAGNSVILYCARLGEFWANCNNFDFPDCNFL